nr:MAG TPA: hypothetical protein [Bacteriophage sp.]
MELCVYRTYYCILLRLCPTKSCIQYHLLLNRTQTRYRV